MYSFRAREEIPYYYLRLDIKNVIMLLTVQGQRNHYNVKEQKGYGVSITLKDNRPYLKGGKTLLDASKKPKNGLPLKFLMRR